MVSKFIIIGIVTSEPMEINNQVVLEVEEKHEVKNSLIVSNHKIFFIDESKDLLPKVKLLGALVSIVGYINTYKENELLFAKEFSLLSYEKFDALGKE